MNIRLRLISAVAIAGVFTPFAVSAQQYTVTDLGTFGGTISNAYGLNANGEVVGYATFAGDLMLHGFVSDAVTHQIRDLGTLGGVNSEARAINDSGQITGAAYISGQIQHAYSAVRAGGPLIDLGTLGGTSSVGFAINANGKITGWSHNLGDAEQRIFISDATAGTMTDLGTLGGSFGVGLSINSSARVVGASYLAGDTSFHAFVRAPNGSSLIDLGTLGGAFSDAMSINDGNQIVGWSHIVSGAVVHAFSTNPVNNAMIDLGTLGGVDSVAMSVNNFGQIVGFSKTSAGVDHGFLYANGSMLDLNSMIVPSQQAAYTIQFGNAINDKGQIAAAGIVTASGEQHALLLSPASVAPTVQPTFTATAGTNGWYRSSVNLSWTVTGAPAPTTTGCGSVAVTTDTKGRVFTCTATNSVGTASQSVTVKVDQTLPQTTITSPQASNEKTYNRNQAVFAKYTCSDLMSGVASCVGSVANGVRVSTTTPGIYSFVVTATDRAGNTSSKTLVYRVR